MGMQLILSEPVDWRDLQNKVSLLLSQSGFETEIEKKVSTPRGNVEIDVFAIDPGSIDKITYVVECKNWNAPVNQSVIHAFTTVMNETGSNIGYIVSKTGFQEGAVRYTQHTNIKLFSFLELQNHYYKSWMINYFAPQLENYVERCNLYVEPCNCARDIVLADLNEADKNIYKSLVDKYGSFIVTLEMMAVSINYLMKVKSEVDYISINWTKFFEECEKIELHFKGLPLSELLIQLRNVLNSIATQFDKLFDEDIFI
jgi:hypothetical protein